MVLVTLAALVVYRAGCLLPVPGLNSAAITALMTSTGLGTGAVERVSIFALGVMPLLSAMILAEVAKIVFPRFRAWSIANAAYLKRLLEASAIALAGVQSFGIAYALEDVAGIVVEPGVGFRLSTVLTMVAGTAFLIWLADLISRRGIGHGFWILLSAPVLAKLPHMVLGVLELVSQGAISQFAVLLFAAFIVLGTAAVVALAKADGGEEFADFPNGSVGPWPPILAYAMLGWLLVSLTMIGPTREIAAQISQHGHPVQLALLALLGGLFALLYSRPVREGTPARGTLAYLTAAALLAVLLVPELISSYFQMPLIIDGRWLVILTSVALSTLPAIFGGAEAKAAGLPR